MKLGLINSAWAQAGRDTAYGIRMTREIGFDTIDIFADPLDIDIKERKLIKRGAKHKESGDYHYLISNAGKKHIDTNPPAPP